MNNKLSSSKTLGPISANLVTQLLNLGKIIFTLDDALSIYGDMRQEVIKLLSDLVNRGVLVRIKSGVYCILQTGQENAQLSNWPVIAKHLVASDDYYISHYSAMRLHGMTTHALTNILITMPKRQRQKKISNFNYGFIYSKPNHFWGVETYWVTRHEKVNVSDLERTLLDGLERPELCGGIKELVRGIWVKQKQINWGKLLQYAAKFHTKAAIKRLGYILELLNLGEGYVSQLLLIVSPAKDYILLDPYGSKMGHYLERWHIRLNMNIEELKEGIWG
jgi:predicted transcriptional regulator of viral defense system